MTRLLAIFRRTPELEAFAAQAAARPALWRVFASLMTVLALLLGGGVALGFVATQLSWDASWLQGVQTLSTRAGALFALSTFIIWWVALAISLRLFHRRGLRSLLGPEGRFPLRRFAQGFGVAAVFAIVTIPVGMIVADAPVPSGLTLAAWFGGAAIAAPLLFIQTGAEELLFRGYLLQQLAYRFRTAWIWAVAPSLIFGALHWNPAAPGGALLTIAITGGSGVMLAVVTARTGDIGAAWGLHFGVNLVAILGISAPDYFSGLAYYHWPAGEASLARLAATDLIVIGILSLGAAHLVLRRRVRPSPPGG